MMKKRSLLKISLITFFTAVMIMSSVSLAQIKAATVGPADVILTKTTYGSAFYTEGIEILPLRNTSAGVHVGFIGGSVELPFDVTGSQYNNLQLLTFAVSNQKLWNRFATRRFWDIADGATLLLGFIGDPDTALDLGKSIELMIETAYNFSLTLVYGKWNNSLHTTILVYQGLLRENSFNDFTNIYPEYISDEGFGEGITASVLNNAPVKAMGFSLYRGGAFRALMTDELRLLFPAVGLASTFIPVVECGWINPDALVKTNTIIEMNLTSIMPNLSTIQGHPDSKISIVSMKLPYVVNVIVVDPKPDNMYSHLKGEFEWIIKLELPTLLVDSSKVYNDIYVKYDLNLTGLTHYPQVIGEMSLANTLPINGGDNITYEFTFENVGNEPAYDISLGYGEFNLENIDGIPIPVNNPELTFDESKVVYYDTDTNILTDIDPSIGNIITITGWFFNTTSGDWLRNNEIVLPEEFDNPQGIIYIEDKILTLDPMDFSYKNITNEDGTETGYATLSATIDELNPGQNKTLQFAINNIPTGTFTQYQLTENSATEITLSINQTLDYEDLIIIVLQLLGSSLHFPEDQFSWSNLIPQPVVGATFYYTDANDKEYLGITNGLVLQVYDDEAILICKLSLDKDIYRFGEEVTFSLEFTNIGNADATNVQYLLFHGFVDEDYNMRYMQAIPDTDGVIPVIEAGNTVIAEETTYAQAEVGLHPVFAVFGYTSSETIDPDYPLIFSSVRHPAVFSSLDFGIVLPPLSKEGSTEPTYPTPEVEVTTEVLGFIENETTVGDVITLRATITNTGDEATNIIYIQRIPRRLAYVEDSLSITIDGEPVTDFELEWFAYQPDINEGRYNPWMPIVRIYSERQDGELIGIPLDVNETLVIEADFTILRSRGIDYVDWESIGADDLIGIYIPPAEVRFNSHYDMTRTTAVNEEVDIPREDTESATASIASSLQETQIITINAEPDIGEEWSSTNSWGSYS
ncbi:MAG: hypothetical protein FK734_12230, partial [Asgard group archaeon]|nr:hypothetical protein [Asgard group archaeon]